MNGGVLNKEGNEANIIFLPLPTLHDFFKKRNEISIGNPIYFL